jgi:hypothetical protein
MPSLPEHELCHRKHQIDLLLGAYGFTPYFQQLKQESTPEKVGHQIRVNPKEIGEYWVKLFPPWMFFRF